MLMALDRVKIMILINILRKVTFSLPAVAGYHALSSMLSFYLLQ